MKKLLSALLVFCMIAGIGVMSVSAKGVIHTLTLNTPNTVSDENAMYGWGGLDFAFRPTESGVYTIHVEGNFDLLEFSLGDTSMDMRDIEVFDGLSGSWTGDYGMTAEKNIRFVIKCETSDPYTVTITIKGSGQPDSELKCWETLPSWLQCILRYILFGWIWMN